MLPTTLLLALRRRTLLRRALSLAGYVGGAAAVAYGAVLFTTGPALSDGTLASGYWLCGGLAAVAGTHELRAAIRAVSKPTPIESWPPWTPFLHASTAYLSGGAHAQAQASPGERTRQLPPAGMPRSEVGTAAGGGQGTTGDQAMRYDFSMVAGIRNPLLRALAAMLLVASPVLVAFAALGGFALLWSLSVIHGI